MSEKPLLKVRVAEALGWLAWRETRGDYKLAVVQAPGKEAPWKSVQSDRQEAQRKRYEPISCAEAERIGYFGKGFPDYDTDWSATGPLIERYGIGLQAPESFATTMVKDTRWGAYDVRTDLTWRAVSPLVAVCEAIVDLSASGNLRDTQEKPR